MIKGDWIRDKRQGHGEMEYVDGTFYDVIFFLEKETSFTRLK